MSDMKYARIIEAAVAAPWAILPSKLAIIQDLIAFRAAGGKLTAEEIKARVGEIEAANGRSDVRGGAVAVLPVLGTIMPRANLMSEFSGGTSVQGFTKKFRQALADPEVSGIVLDVDSPGGQVGGVAELAAEIYSARGTKPIVAVANGLAASAAYWIATAADELVVTPSGDVGSVGVFAMHQDVSAYMEQEGVKIEFISAGKYKTEGNPYEPLTDTARAAIQLRIDEFYNMFTDDVARGRGVDAATVRGGFGEGRLVGAETAVRLGMADRVATFDEVVADLLGNVASGRRGALADDSEMRQRRLRVMSL